MRLAFNILALAALTPFLGVTAAPIDKEPVVEADLMPIALGDTFLAYVPPMSTTQSKSY
jgi:hypothetical protein